MEFEAVAIARSRREGQEACLASSLLAQLRGNLSSHRQADSLDGWSDLQDRADSLWAWLPPFKPPAEVAAWEPHMRVDHRADLSLLPDRYSGRVPLHTRGHGLFASLSLAVAGHEDLGLWFRLYTAVEMVVSRDDLEDRHLEHKGPFRDEYYAGWTFNCLAGAGPSCSQTISAASLALGVTIEVVVVKPGTQAKVWTFRPAEESRLRPVVLMWYRPQWPYDHPGHLVPLMPTRAALRLSPWLPAAEAPITWEPLKAYLVLAMGFVGVFILAHHLFAAVLGLRPGKGGGNLYYF